MPGKHGSYGMQEKMGCRRKESCDCSKFMGCSWERLKEGGLRRKKCGKIKG